MNTELNEVISAVGPDFHGLSYRERLIVGAVLKRLSSPPADDVREALAFALFRHEYVYASDAWAEATWPRSEQLRQVYREKADAILAAFEVRPYGTVTPPTDEASIATPTPGLYRNGLGAELLVTGTWLPNLQGERRQTLGDIATAETPPDVFGVTHYLVTSRSLAAAGYVFMPREARS